MSGWGGIGPEKESAWSRSFARSVLGSLALAACAHVPVPRPALDEAPPRLVSAFFGLDHALPPESRWLCAEGPGRDGLPVTFSRRVVGRVDPSAFTVTTRSGSRLHPTCATTAPATGRSKNHTVLLIGELGAEPADPPVRVEVTGSLPLEGGADAQGLNAEITPLDAGPTLVLAFAGAPKAVDSSCPVGARQVVVVVWAGGVTPAPGKTAEDHRAGYRVSTTEGPVTPFALGDLGDRDNYVHLCLDTDAAATRVSFAPGLLVDPRGDANPETSVEVSLPATGP